MSGARHASLRIRLTQLLEIFSAPAISVTEL
jgi:hypothetical protein